LRLDGLPIGTARVRSAEDRGIAKERCIIECILGAPAPFPISTREPSHDAQGTPIFQINRIAPRAGCTSLEPHAGWFRRESRIRPPHLSCRRLTILRALSEVRRGSATASSSAAPSSGKSNRTQPQARTRRAFSKRMARSHSRKSRALFYLHRVTHRLRCTAHALKFSRSALQRTSSAVSAVSQSLETWKFRSPNPLALVATLWRQQ
jgi:hypothetical protein